MPGLGFGGTADYPTMAITQNSLIIGTNDFAPASAGGANSFRGTTVNLIPLNSIFDAAGPRLRAAFSITLLLRSER